MAGLTRRLFLKTLAPAVPAAVLPPAAFAGSAEAAAAQDPLDPGLLRALAEVVLPSELGQAGVDRVVHAFRAWAAGYRPVAELDHRYGAAEVRYSGPDPVPGWGAQLRALELEARQRHGRAFAELEAAVRQEMVRGQLAREQVDALPPPAEARHVAVGLLAFFYDSPEATDLCYGARIGRLGCRPLSSSGSRPPELARDG
ncbi:MAG TPA: hypothetical protein VF192_00230 [Longimicrobiales bacterium]